MIVPAPVTVPLFAKLVSAVSVPESLMVAPASLVMMFALSVGRRKY